MSFLKIVSTHRLKVSVNIVYNWCSSQWTLSCTHSQLSLSCLQRRQTKSDTQDRWNCMHCITLGLGHTWSIELVATMRNSCNVLQMTQVRLPLYQEDTTFTQLQCTYYDYVLHGCWKAAQTSWVINIIHKSDSSTILHYIWTETCIHRPLAYNFSKIG